MAQYPAPTATATPNRLITKTDTAGQISLTGTTVTATTTGTSAGAYGSWAQVTASSSAQYFVVGVYAKMSAASMSSTIKGPIYVDIGTGGAGSETAMATAIVEGIFTVDGTSWFAGGVSQLAVPLRVSASTRIAVRTALDATTAGKTVNAHLLVVPYANVEGN